MTAPDNLPEHLGPYRVTGRLGHGGMGEVLRGHDDRLDRPVALKRVRPGGKDPEKARQRFRREARVVARLSHQAIVQVYDWVDADDQDWLVMELIDGRPLDVVLEDGPLPPERAARIAREIASGLAEAHDAGLVHRDLKAANVMVTTGGGQRVKILDFGIAKQVGLVAAGSHIEDQLTTLTEAGQVIGTVASMSPEQALGYPVDHRSDLFSLGTLLYEMLSGVSPFQGDSAVETLSRICSARETPLRDLDPRVPAGLAGLVGRLLEKQPERRPADAREVVAELDRLATTQTEVPAISAAAGTASPDDATLEMDTPGQRRSVMRTLLLSDLVESTKLVERLGDERAAALFEQHDRLARQLMAEHEGKEVDKSDGFLILFARPLAAVRYSLAYHAALADLAGREGMELATRVGIHLGEVVVRENDTADIARGAKPLEVEGLAKAMAARLMSLARGGQTLISRGVHNMARRAAVGAAALPDGLRWVEHGRYLLKGVEEPVAVFEVGVEGSAPLAAPADSEKVARVDERPETYTLKKASLKWGAPIAAAGVLILGGLWGMASWLGPPVEIVPHITGADGEPGQANDGPELDSHELYQRGMGYLERYDKKGNIAKAIAAFQKALALDEGSAPALAGLARAYLSDTTNESKDPMRLEHALAAARKAVELDEFLAVARVSLGLVYVETGQLEEAGNELEQALQIEPLNADAWFGLGMLSEAGTQVRQAEERYRKAIELRSDWVFYSRLGAMYYRSGRYQDAEGAFLRSLELAPDNYLGYRNLGGMYYMQGKLDEAATQYQKALRIQPEPSVYTGLGNIYFAQGLYPESVSAFKKAIETGGSNFYFMWGNLGDAYRWTPDNEELARDAFVHAIRILREKLVMTPKNVTLRTLLALYSAKLGDCQQVASQTPAIRALAGEDVMAYFRLAVANEICSRRDSALAALDLALQGGLSISTVRGDPELLDLRKDVRYHGLVTSLQPQG